jgi:hypothetical protein
MGKKPLTSENDLSFAESERIREIVDHQVRQKHNIDFLKDISKETQENLFYKVISNRVGNLVMLVLGGVLTIFIQKSFNFFETGSTPNNNFEVTDFKQREQPKLPTPDNSSSNTASSN